MARYENSSPTPDVIPDLILILIPIQRVVDENNILHPISAWDSELASSNYQLWMFVPLFTMAK
ncbi:Uncharacterised protein [Bordetella ansorpii]|uniref:Uncharacterized protein n=1 Tax=Bordetella ansorpii TaxID=288768 RepID=A0A157S9C0_9BORD|nr:Uncharacterised protein [Bordetella ansorpii]